MEIIVGPMDTIAVMHTPVHPARIQVKDTRSMPLKTTPKMAAPLARIANDDQGTTTTDYHQPTTV
jgi:hypothetical protein